MRTPHNTTLAFEAILRHPDFDRIVEDIRTRTPAAFLDQLDAANADTYRQLASLARSIDGAKTHRPGSPDETPGWVRLGAADTLRRFCDRTADTCRHSPDPDAPQPIYGAAWRPGLVVCARCTHLLATHGVADRTCDGCGHICTGPDHGDGIHPAASMLGVLIYRYGLCVSCYRDMCATHAREESR